MKKLFVLVSFLVAATMLLAACGPEPTPTPVATEPPITMGTAEDPIVMALAPSANTETLMAGGEAIAAKITELTGLVITTTVPTNYAALIEAMGSGNAQIGWLPPAAYIVAHEKGYADVGMITMRNGADHYAFQLMTHADRVADGTFTVYYDPEEGVNTTNTAEALDQFNGKKPCWTDPLSASGYLVPAGYIANLGVSVKAGAWVQGHPTVVKSIYLSPKGEICDFGATYVDARSSVAKDFPDVNEKVVVLWVSDARIPNDTVAYAAEVPAEIRDAITAALIEIASTEEGLQLLKDGGYSIGGLKAVDDAFFDDFRVYLQSINFDFTNYK